MKSIIFLCCLLFVSQLASSRVSKCDSTKDIIELHKNSFSESFLGCISKESCVEPKYICKIGNEDYVCYNDNTDVTGDCKKRDPTCGYEDFFTKSEGNNCLSCRSGYIILYQSKTEAESQKFTKCVKKEYCPYTQAGTASNETCYACKFY